jgi:hypothetical protein
MWKRATQANTEVWRVKILKSEHPAKKQPRAFTRSHYVLQGPTWRRAWQAPQLRTCASEDGGCV